MADPIRRTCGSGLWRRWKAAACRAIRRRRSFALAVSTAISWLQRFRRTGRSRRARWVATSRRRSGGASGLADRAVPAATSPCVGWLPSWRSVAWRSITTRCGSSFTPRGSASKKPWSPASRIAPTSRAAARNGGNTRRGLIPRRLVFIDETWTKTNMAPLRGWATLRRAAIAKVPYGHWNTMTFVAALRLDRIEAPWLLDGPINGERFRIYVEKVLAPTLSAGDIVIARQSRQPQGQARATGHPRRRGQAVLLLPKYSPDLNPIEQVFAKLKHLLRKAAARNTDAVCDAIAQLLNTYSPEECANYFRNSGYGYT